RHEHGHSFRQRRSTAHVLPQSPVSAPHLRLSAAKDTAHSWLHTPYIAAAMWTVRRLFFCKSQTALARANCERSPVLVEPEGYRTFRHESPNDRFRRAVLPGREIPRPTISP